MAWICRKQDNNIEKLIEELKEWNENLISEFCADDKMLCDDLCDNFEQDCIVIRAVTALMTLQTENAKLKKIVDKYATAARSIALSLKDFCDRNLPYDQMVAEAARKASAKLEQMKAEQNGKEQKMAVRPIDAEKYMELLKEQYLHHKSMGNIQATKAWQGAMQLLYDIPTLTPPNDPLTPDELKKWNRNPAWIMPLGEQPWDAQWSIMEYGRFVVETNMGPTKSVCLSMGESGKTWLAYRRPVAGNGLNIDGNKRLHNSGESEESLHEFK